MCFFLSALLLLVVNKTIDAAPGERGSYMSHCEATLFNLSRFHPNNNFVVAPFGIWSLINSVAYGAEGDTLHEILRAFQIPENRMAQINAFKAMRKTVVNEFAGVMDSHNFIFFDQSVKLCPYVEEVLSKEFGSDVKRLDFSDPLESSVTANYFIKRVADVPFEAYEPRDFVKDSFLLSTVRNIKGIFYRAFDAESTTIRTFFNEDGFEIGKANFMHMTAHLPHISVPELGSNIVELSYGEHDHYSLLLVVPFSDYKLDKIQSKLHRLDLKHTLKKLNNNRLDRNVFVELMMPRFRIRTETLKFRHPLNEIGIYSAYDAEAATFSLMAYSKLFIKKMSQLAIIEVDEQGIIPPNVTNEAFKNQDPNTIELQVIKVNRPFLFFLLSKPSATILFEGIYSTPEIH